MGQLKIPTFGLPETPFDSPSYNEENIWKISGVEGGGGGRVMPQYKGLQIKESCYRHDIITFPKRHKVCDG